MGLNVISRKALLQFADVHADARKPLDAWYRIAKAARWANLVEIQRALPSAETVGKHTVFNIKGNAYRLITEINYRKGFIFIRAVLTHAEYDKDRWK